jgi:hypothetical protein
MEVFRTRFVRREEPEALVIHCSDPRYQAHFQEFLHRSLGYESYELIAVPGGPQFLTLTEYLPKFAWTGWRWTRFLVDVARPTRAVLIAHENCRWYLDGRFHQYSGDLRARQMEDLRRVKREIEARFPGINVSTYFARVEREDIVFEALAS